LIKTIHIKLLLLFSLSILFGHSAFAQTNNSGPEVACDGQVRNYRVEGAENSDIRWVVVGGTIFNEEAPDVLVDSGTDFTEMTTASSVVDGAFDSQIKVIWDANLTEHSIIATETATGGCSTSTPLLNVTVKPLPNPNIAGSKEVCAIDPIYPVDTEIYTTEADMTSYTWTVSSQGVILSGADTNEITVKWITAGTGTVSVNYENTNGCSATSATSETITIYARPSPSGISTDE